MNNPTPDPSRTVLIGDTSQERFNLLEKILREDFYLHALRFPNFQALFAKVKEHSNWRLVIFTVDLPYSAKEGERQPLPDKYSEDLTSELVPLVCIGEDEQGPKLPVNIRYLCAPQQPDSESRKEVIGVLRTFASAFPKKARLPELVLREEGDRTLREQIRSLSDERNLDEGKDILKHLICLFFNCDNVTIEIERLGQGLSGASVFLFQVKDGLLAKSYVLKLTPKETEWKLEKEVEKHERARMMTEISHLRSYLPRLHPCLDSQYLIASYSNWTAVCYDYLGGEKIGKIIDLETLLVCSIEELRDKTAGSKLHIRHFNSGGSLTESRSNLFGEFLNWLCDEWCPANGGIKRGERRLWLPDDSPPDWSPYELKGRDIGRILGFLDSKDAGKVARLLPKWEEHRERVWEFVEHKGYLTGQTALNDLFSVTLSLAHGDMNSNNVMLWMEYAGHPLLIDLPFFQESGHAMQDFARLEIEIIYALMDCQAENADSLRASDHTHTQLPLWIRLADHLLDENKWEKKTAWKKSKFTANIEHCLDLIRLLRRKAANVQKQGKPEDSPPKFFAEYLPALLYYTLREIGYGSRTVFKRLLAIYSASQILTRIEGLPVRNRRV
ncbi:MAG: hypothetical protein AB7U82_20500 [Blastocatellales bacterium]